MFCKYVGYCQSKNGVIVDLDLDTVDLMFVSLHMDKVAEQSYYTLQSYYPSRSRSLNRCHLEKGSPQKSVSQNDFA